MNLAVRNKMKNFKDFIVEAADSKVNLHLTHVDEDIFERGNKGADAAIKSLEDVLHNLGKGTTKLTVKWDGAPAIFAGKDPADGKFFVGTKAVFNKNAKLNKTKDDIKANHQGELAKKLTYALEHFPKIGIPDGTVLQGDLMFSKGDQKYETIDGKRWITAHPNTIVYAWESESDVGKKIRKADIGVVWHTTYKGKGDLSTYRASFGVDVFRLKQNSAVWMDDAYFKAGHVAFTEQEGTYIEGIIRAAKSTKGDFNSIAKLMSTLPSGAVGAGVKTFVNSKIRNGELPNPSTAAKEYLDYVEKYFEDKVVSKVKTDAAKEQKRTMMKQFIQTATNNFRDLVAAFEFVDLMTKGKVAVIKKLEKINSQKSFVRTKDGFKVTGAEGYVAINPTEGEAVKFVDRIAFSHFNFSDKYIKGWQK